MVNKEKRADLREQAKRHWQCNGKDVIAGGPDSGKEKFRAIMAPFTRGCKTKFLCTNTTEKQALNRLISP
ncbi:hypothetical protein [Kluyvera georgiana]|uniref:hypothetical protein n=1 Tax=Kluyvera georgiana TaxID=73098 RepID=UPI001AE04BA8|nr:hypothetical protein [Kluyvera georgiana]